MRHSLCVIAICFLLFPLCLISYAEGGYLELGKSTKTSNTITVCPVGTEIENGDALKEALSSIVDNSETNPYLIKLEPGIYDLGISALAMKSYVHIEGSGPDLTTIKGNTRTNIYAYGLIHGASFSELRSVTIKNLFDGDITTTNIGIYNENSNFSIVDTNILVVDGYYNYGVFNTGFSQPTLTNVTISATSAYNWSYGIYNSSNVVPILKNVEIRADGGTKSFGIFSDDYCVVTAINVDVYSSSNSWGIYNQGGSALTLKDSHIEAVSYGIVNQQDLSGTGGGGPGGKITIDRSTVIGSAQSLRIESGSGDVFVSYSKIDGPIIGTPTCIGAFDDAYIALDGACN